MQRRWWKRRGAAVRLVSAIAVGCALVMAWSDVRADQASTYYHQAMAYKQQGKIDRALGALKRSLELREDYAAAHRSIGILYRQRKQYGQAVLHLERAAELQPGSGEVHYSLGLAYHGARRRAEAIKALETAARLEPKSAQIVAQCGSLLMRVDPEKASKHLEKAVKLEPRSGDHLHQLGLAYRRSAARAAARKNRALHDRYMKLAKQYLTRAAAIKDTPGLHFDLGVFYRRADKLPKAIEHYERAVELDPKLAAAWWDLGHMYAKNKQSDQAVEAYQRYLALKGSNKDASIARKRIKELELERKRKSKRKR